MGTIDPRSAPEITFGNTLHNRADNRERGVAASSCALHVLVLDCVDGSRKKGRHLELKTAQKKGQVAMARRVQGPSDELRGV
jgi:hypothetical protein